MDIKDYIKDTSAPLFALAQFSLTSKLFLSKSLLIEIGDEKEILSTLSDEFRQLDDLKSSLPLYEQISVKLIDYIEMLQKAILDCLMTTLKKQEEKTKKIIFFIKDSSFKCPLIKKEEYIIKHFSCRISELQNTLPVIPLREFSDLYSALQACHSRQMQAYESGLENLSSCIKKVHFHTLVIEKKILQNMSIDEPGSGSSIKELKSSEDIASIRGALKNGSDHLDKQIKSLLRGAFNRFYKKINFYKTDILYATISPSILLARQIVLEDFSQPKALTYYFNQQVNLIRKTLIKIPENDKAAMVNNLNYFVSLKLLAEYLNKDFFISDNEKGIFKKLFSFNQSSSILTTFALDEKEAVVEDVISLLGMVNRSNRSIDKPGINDYLSKTFLNVFEAHKIKLETLKKEIEIFFDFSENKIFNLSHSFKHLKDEENKFSRYYKLVLQDLTSFEKVLDNKNNNACREFVLTVAGLNSLYKNFKNKVHTIIDSEYKLLEDRYQNLRHNQASIFEQIPVLSGDKEKSLFKEPLIIVTELEALDKSKADLNDYNKSDPYSQKMQAYSSFLLVLNAFIAFLKREKNKSSLGIWGFISNVLNDDIFSYQLALNLKEPKLTLHQMRAQLITCKSNELIKSSDALLLKLTEVKNSFPTDLVKDKWADLELQVIQKIPFSESASVLMTSMKIEEAALTDKAFYNSISKDIDTIKPIIKIIVNEKIDALRKTIDTMPSVCHHFYLHNNYTKSLGLDKKEALVEIESYEGIDNVKVMFENLSTYQKKLELFEGNNNKAFPTLLIQLLHSLQGCITTLKQENYTEKSEVLLKRLHDALLIEKINFLHTPLKEEQLKCVVNCKLIIERSLYDQEKGLESLSQSKDKGLVNYLLNWLRVNVLKPLTTWFNLNINQPVYGASTLEKTVFWAVAPVYQYEATQGKVFAYNECK